MEVKYHQVDQVPFFAPGSESEQIVFNTQYREAWIQYQKVIALPVLLERIGLDHLMQ